MDSNTAPTPAPQPSTAAPAAPVSAPAAKAPAAAPPVLLSIEQIRAQQNFGLAAAAGIGAAILGAIAWAIVTVVSGYELGIAAIGIGYVVGLAIQNAGKGIDRQFGILGAVCGGLGCLMGNALSVISYYAQANKIGYFDALGEMDPNTLANLVALTWDPLDIVFYGIAIYAGYKYAFKYQALK